MCGRNGDLTRSCSGGQVRSWDIVFLDFLASGDRVFCAPHVARQLPLPLPWLHRGLLGCAGLRPDPPPRQAATSLESSSYEGSLPFGTSLTAEPRDPREALLSATASGRFSDMPGACPCCLELGEGNTPVCLCLPWRKNQVDFWWDNEQGPCRTVARQHPPVVLGAPPNPCTQPAVGYPMSDSHTRSRPGPERLMSVTQSDAFLSSHSFPLSLVSPGFLSFCPM